MVNYLPIFSTQLQKNRLETFWLEKCIARNLVDTVSNLLWHLINFFVNLTMLSQLHNLYIICRMSQGIVISCRTSGACFTARAGIFIPITASLRFWDHPASSPVDTGVWRTDRRAYHSYSFSTETKNAWSFPSTPLYVCMHWCFDTVTALPWTLYYVHKRSTKFQGHYEWFVRSLVWIAAWRLVVLTQDFHCFLQTAQTAAAVPLNRPRPLLHN
jgi:hypothetical protein